MADYYPLIARAVASLPQNTEAARRALYERARSALGTQLRGKTPTLSESEVNRERQLLDDAIRKVETEVNGKPPATAVHHTLVVKEQPRKHAVAPRIVIGVLSATLLIAIGLFSAWRNGTAQDKPPHTPAASVINNSVTSVSQPEYEYKLIDGVDYDVRVKTLIQDAYGNFSADGVELIFDGQPVQLVDGKIANNWLETKDFGKIMIKNSFGLAVYVTADQNDEIRRVFAPKANLTSASRYGDLLRVKTLLATKVDVNSKDDQGFTALALASEGRHLEVVQALLAAGADVNARCRDGFTALMFLLQGTSPKDESLAQTLIAAGANVNAQAENGTTALMMALHNPKVIQILLAAGADVNARDEDGNTALMNALKWHSDEVAELLRQHSGNGQ